MHRAPAATWRGCSLTHQAASRCGGVSRGAVGVAGDDEAGVAEDPAPRADGDEPPGDENLSASGPRFTGKTPDDWRKAVSNRITYSNNIIAEGLSHSTHPKFEHSKGSLIHDNVNDILLIGNLYAHNYERNPLFKGGARGVVVNNLIYDPGPRAVAELLIEVAVQCEARDRIGERGGAVESVGVVAGGGQELTCDVGSDAEQPAEDGGGLGDGGT